MSSTCNVSDEHKKQIENLFTSFAAFYGHIWRSQFKSEGFLDFAKKEWVKALKVFSREILNEAVIECRSNCEMPPTLPQMVGLCRGIKKRKDFFVRDTEVSRAKQEVVTSNLREMRAKLR